MYEQSPVVSERPTDQSARHTAKAPLPESVPLSKLSMLWKGLGLPAVVDTPSSGVLADMARAGEPIIIGRTLVRAQKASGKWMVSLRDVKDAVLDLAPLHTADLQACTALSASGDGWQADLASALENAQLNRELRERLGEVCERSYFWSSRWGFIDYSTVAIRRRSLCTRRYSREMSTDPFADLARTLENFSKALRAAINENHGNYAPGSTGAAECADEPFASEWGDRPAQSAIGHGMLAANSCIDHLTGAALLIRARTVTVSLYTIVRGASESASIASYVLDPKISPRERVRRVTNCRLEGLCEEIQLLRPFATEPDAAELIKGAEARIAALERSADQHGFTFHKADRMKPAYLGEQPPSATKLIGECAFAAEPRLGSSLYRVMSGVSHAKAHGLIRLTRPSDQPFPPGVRARQVNVSAGLLAQDLFAGPLSATTMVEHLMAFLGWDDKDVSLAVVAMLEVWGRIRGTPYPGPSNTA